MICPRRYGQPVVRTSEPVALPPRYTVRIDVIQGGANSSRVGARFTPVPLERTRNTGLQHRDGQGFAAFGTVTSGMDIVRAIQRSPVTAQAITPPGQIVRVWRGTP